VKVFIGHQGGTQFGYTWSVFAGPVELAKGIVFCSEYLSEAATVKLAVALGDQAKAVMESVAIRPQERVELSKIERYACDNCSGDGVAGRFASMMFLVDLKGKVIPAYHVCELCVDQYGRALRSAGLCVTVVHRGEFGHVPPPLRSTAFGGIVYVREGENPCS
jgi:hypothetical protein